MHNVVCIPYEFFLKMSEGEALLLHYLQQETADMMHWLKLDKDMGTITESDALLLEQMEKGLFPMGSEKISNDIAMTSARQTKYLKILQKKKHIRIHRRGLPARRWISFVE